MIKPLVIIIGSVLFVVALGVSLSLPKIIKWFQLREAELFSARLEKNSCRIGNNAYLDDVMGSQNEISLSKADIYLKQGKEYFAKGYFYAAIFCYNQAIRINPKNVSSFINRGKTYDRINKLYEAILDFDQAIEIDPNNVEAYGLRGFVFIEKGNLDKAIADCNKALEIKPDEFPAMGKEEVLDTNIADNNTDHHNSAAYFHRGTAYEYKGELLQALSDYTKAIEIGSSLNQKSYYLARTKLYFKMHEYDKSLEDVGKLESLGSEIDVNFVTKLKKLSRRDS